ncbi:hypothetical protein [Sinorhizobium meliloti]|uniref:hypothetical protein n=1 Tax=Rhizobium meliloti TaxID=382 RepID=UPI00299F0F15
MIADSISDVDERGFPHTGNVPVVRLDPHGVDRIDIVINRLLDEVSRMSIAPWFLCLSFYMAAIL